jgi:hypothetical protein
MKIYKNYLDNQRERKRLEHGGCSHIKVANGIVISYINGKGELIKAAKKDEQI